MPRLNLDHPGAANSFLISDIKSSKVLGHGALLLCSGRIGDIEWWGNSGQGTTRPSRPWQASRGWVILN